jgi:hypothetical protein
MKIRDIRGPNDRRQSPRQWDNSEGIGPSPRRRSPRRQRGIWHLVHLKSGLAFLIINMPTAEDASEIAEIIINYANWRKFATPSAIAAADPQWMPKILGIKHSLPGQDWMEMLDAAMNDPARIVWYDPNGPRQ